MSIRYVGDGPYCAAYSLTMLFGSRGPGPEVIEVLSGSPFGMAIHGEDLPFWCPQQWNPEIGLTTAIDMLGWTCDRTAGSAGEAVDRLRQATRDEPVLAGPVDYGLVPYVPGLGQAIGAEHVLVVIGVEGDMVRAHDSQGWPFVTVPVDDLLAAWTAESLPYPVDAFQVRSGFRQVRDVDPHAALRQCVPQAARWLEGDESVAAAERLAKVLDGGLTNMQWKYLVEFSVHGGARRLADAARLFGEVGYTAAAEILENQAMLTGSLQYPIVKRDNAGAAAIVRKLAPTYPQLHAELLKITSS